MAIDSSLLGSSATAPLASRVTWPEQVSGFVRAKPLGVVGALIILVMLLVAAVAHRDYPVVQALIFLIAFGFVVVNLLVDLTYAWFDPRIRYR